MARNFPFEINADKYSRQLWSKQAYLYLAEFFRKAVFDSEAQVLEGGTIDDYRYSGSDDGWRLPCGGGGETSAYRSYFRVIDASTYDASGNLTACKVGVTNGSAVMLDPVGNCGTVKINNERVDVAAATETVSSDGVYYVWIHSWIAELGPDAEIRITANSTAPANVNAGIAFSSQLAGRVQVTKADGVYSIAGITQDYLRGGEYETWLWGDCGGLELEE